MGLRTLKWLVIGSKIMLILGLIKFLSAVDSFFKLSLGRWIFGFRSGVKCSAIQDFSLG